VILKLITKQYWQQSDAIYEHDLKYLVLLYIIWLSIIFWMLNKKLQLLA